MPIVTPSNGTYEIPELQDYEAYKGRLVTFEIVENEYQGKQQTRLQADLALGEDDNDTLRDWMGVALGTQRSGQVSRLRAFLNSAVGKSETTEIKWFNTDTFEWGYTPHAERSAATTEKLVAGMEVIFRGKNGQRQDGQHKFSITAYQPIPRETEKPAGRRAAPQPIGQMSGKPGGESSTDEAKVPF